MLIQIPTNCSPHRLPFIPNTSQTSTEPCIHCGKTEDEIEENIPPNLVEYVVQRGWLGIYRNES